MSGDQSASDGAALDRWVERCYAELRPLAAAQLRGEGGAHTLNTTALVHEAYARLAKAEVGINDRQHFFRIAARAMRRVLVDHARARDAQKRGDGERALPLTTGLSGEIAARSDPWEVLMIDGALEELEKLDPRTASMVELHYFAGIEQADIAAALSLSLSTVERGLRFARAWFRDRLGAM